MERGHVGSEAVQRSREEKAFETHNWYFTREEIEKNSPSIASGLRLDEENYRRLSYCSFLQEVGMHLQLRPEAIASAMVFCHRFFLHRSHSTNDRYVVAIASLYLAGKVEEEPRSLKDVIRKAKGVQAKKRAANVEKSRSDSGWFDGGPDDVIAQEELLLTTLGFDLSITHPYETVMASSKEFGVAQESLAQVARNFLNDGLRTTLTLQYRSHHLAAGALYMASKFLKVQLPGTDGQPWWHCFDVTMQELEGMCDQLLELYEYANSQSRTPNQKPSSGANTATRPLRAPQVEGSPARSDGGAVGSKNEGGTPTDETTTPAVRSGEDERKCSGGGMPESGDVKEEQGGGEGKKSRERPSESESVDDERDMNAERVDKKSRLAVEDGEVQEQETPQ